MIELLGMAFCAWALNDLNEKDRQDKRLKELKLMNKIIDKKLDILALLELHKIKINPK